MGGQGVLLLCARCPASCRPFLELISRGGGSIALRAELPEWRGQCRAVSPGGGGPSGRVESLVPGEPRKRAFRLNFSGEIAPGIGDVRLRMYVCDSLIC